MQKFLLSSLWLIFWVDLPPTLFAFLKHILGYLLQYIVYTLYNRPYWLHNEKVWFLSLQAVTQNQSDVWCDVDEWFPICRTCICSCTIVCVCVCACVCVCLCACIPLTSIQALHQYTRTILARIILFHRSRWQKGNELFGAAVDSNWELYARSCKTHMTKMSCQAKDASFPMFFLINQC